MNLAAWPHSLQSAFAAGLVLALFTVLSHVRKTTISDKYGVTWTALLSVLFYLDFQRDWFSIVSLEASILALLAATALIALGILFSIRVTEYSRVRRVSIQEVALLRYRYQELYKKLETSDSNQTAQTH